MAGLSPNRVEVIAAVFNVTKGAMARAYRDEMGDGFVFASIFLERGSHVSVCGLRDGRLTGHLARAVIGPRDILLLPLKIRGATYILAAHSDSLRVAAKMTFERDQGSFWKNYGSVVVREKWTIRGGDPPQDARICVEASAQMRE